MLKIAIVIDEWKLKIFEKHLLNADYTFTQFNGPVSKTLTLKVETEDSIALQKIVEEANRECARSKAN